MNALVSQKLDIFFSNYPKQEFSKNYAIIEGNQTPSGVFYVEKGIVRRYWIFENGSEVTLNLYKPHSFLPMSWAIADIPNQHIYESMTDIVVRKAPKKDVLNFLQKNPDVVYDLLTRVYIGMEGLWQHVESLANGNAFIKLVASLIILAKRFGEVKGGKTQITLKLAEQEIANYAGMSRETVSRELQKLKKENAITLNKGFLYIVDTTILEKYLEESQ